MPLLSIEHRPQEEAAGCLAACVEMALGHIGVTVSQRELNRLFALTSLGVPWPRLQRLTQLGVWVAFQTGEEAALQAAIDRNQPPILFVRTGELTTYWQADLQHAVLLVGYDEHHVFLNDPAFPHAPQQTSWAELLLAMVEYDYSYALLTRADAF